MVTNGDVLVVDTIPLAKMDNRERHSLAEQFIFQYYSVMSEAPEALHQFYGQDATMVYENVSACGQTAIAQLFSTFDLKKAKVVIITFDCLASHSNTVLVQLCGELSTCGEPMRRFTRSFTLVEICPGSFYVSSDILRYGDAVYIHNDKNPASGSTKPVSEEKDHPRHTKKVSSSGVVSEQKRREEKTPELSHQSEKQEPEPPKDIPLAPAPTTTPAKVAAEQSSPPAVEKEASSPVHETKSAVQQSEPSQPSQPQQAAPASNAPMSWAQRASGNTAISQVPASSRSTNQQPKPGSAQPANVGALRGGATPKSSRGGRPQQAGGELRKEQNFERNEQRGGYNHAGGARGNIRGRGNRGGQAPRGGAGGFRGAASNVGAPSQTIPVTDRH